MVPLRFGSEEAKRKDRLATDCLWDTSSNQWVPTNGQPGVRTHGLWVMATILGEPAGTPASPFGNAFFAYAEQYGVGWNRLTLTTPGTDKLGQFGLFLHSYMLKNYETYGGNSTFKICQDTTSHTLDDVILGAGMLMWEDTLKASTVTSWSYSVAELPTLPSHQASPEPFTSNIRFAGFPTISL